MLTWDDFTLKQLEAAVNKCEKTDCLEFAAPVVGFLCRSIKSNMTKTIGTFGTKTNTQIRRDLKKREAHQLPLISPNSLTQFLHVSFQQRTTLCLLQPLSCSPVENHCRFCRYFLPLSREWDSLYWTLLLEHSVWSVACLCNGQCCLLSCGVRYPSLIFQPNILAGKISACAAI